MAIKRKSQVTAEQATMTLAATAAGIVAGPFAAFAVAVTLGGKLIYDELNKKK